MGLFGGSKSKSVTEITETNLQEIETRNINLSDFEGTAIADAGDVEIISIETDLDAIQAGSELGREALRSSEKNTEAVLTAAGDITGAAIKATQDTSRQAFDFGGDALDFGKDAVGESFSFAEGSLEESLDFGVSSLDFARDVNESSAEVQQGVIDRAFSFGANTLAQTTDALTGAIGQAADATRSDASQVLNNIVKFGAIAIAVIAAASLLRR